MPVVSDLYIYPIKSCRGIRVGEWRVAERGFVADRRWLIVDAHGKFTSQRDAPQLSQVTITLEGDSLRLSAPNYPELVVPCRFEHGPECAVGIWEDVTVGVEHAAGSAWFSSYLGGRYHLAYMPDRCRRAVDPKRARVGDIVSFADGYPFLLASEASLADLNARLEAPVSMARFRPNIVVSGGEPYAEDGYQRVRIGEIAFRGPKRCARCVMVSVDPATGLTGIEPLRTLSQYRREERNVWFGMNLIHDNVGRVRVGDALEVLDS